MNGLLELKPAIKRNLIFLFFSGLLFWTGITILLPTLPAYIQDVGGTTQQVGIVMGSFAIGLLCSRTWLGRIADSRSRKIVILIGTLVAGTAPIGYIFTQAIIGLAAIRAFHGISIAAFTIGYSALVVDFAPKEHRGKLIGYMNLAVPMGMGIGPALGGFLLTNTDYTILFAFSATCGYSAFLLSSQLREFASKKVKLHNGELNEPTRDFPELIANSALVIPGLVLFLIGLVFGSLVAFLPLYVRELELTSNIVGLFYTTVAIASFTIRISMGRVSDSYGRGVLITCSLFCYILSMSILSQADSAKMLLIAGIAEGVGAGILIPTMLALISDRSYSNERGRVYALCMGGFDVGIALAGPVLGFLQSYLSYSGVFKVTAILSALALVIFVTNCSKNLKHSLAFATGRKPDAYALD